MSSRDIRLTGATVARGRVGATTGFTGGERGVALDPVDAAAGLGDVGRVERGAITSKVVAAADDLGDGRPDVDLDISETWEKLDVGVVMA